MNPDKLMAELERLLKQLLDERSEDAPGFARLERISGQIALLNNLKTNIKAGKFD